MLREPTPDQSHCDIGQHAPICTGYTEDENDTETCMCACHDLTPEAPDAA